MSYYLTHRRRRAGGFASALPVPVALGGLTWWWRGDMGMALSGALIDSWTDSISGLSAGETGAFARPTFTGAYAPMNNQPAALMTALITRLHAPAALALGAQVQGAHGVVLFAQDDGVAPNGQVFSVSDGTTGNRYQIRFWNATGGFQLRLSGATSSQMQTATSFGGNPMVFGVSWDGTAAQPVQWTQTTAETPAGWGSWTPGAMDEMYLGASAVGGEQMGGAIAEACVYNRPLLAADWAALTGYAATRYAI